MIRPVLIHDDDAWDSTLLQLPAPHPLQCSAWAAHKGAYGWTAERWVFRQEDRVRAATLILRRSLVRLPLNILYTPKGPLLDDWSDSGLAVTVLSHLEQVARLRRAIFIKMDPDVDYPPAPDFCSLAADALSTELGRRGWRFSSDQIQYRNTVMLDLRPDEEALLAAMKPKTRYNIRLAQRKGVTVRLGSQDALPAFYQLYAETGQRDGFPIRPYAYYSSVWRRFMTDRLGHLLLAEVEGTLLAGIFLFALGRRAWYVYGASSDQRRDSMPNYLLQWEAMLWARQLGCESYDLWGAPNELREDDPMWGVYRFKSGFGGHFVRHVGAFDYAPVTPLHWVYSRLIRRYLQLLRWQSQPG